MLRTQPSLPSSAQAGGSQALPVFMAALLSASLSLPAQALSPLNEEQLAAVDGAGLALALDDFSLRLAPTSYIELTGTATSNPNWRRGDARYFGLSMTGTGDGTDWYGSGSGAGCTAGSDGLGCPLGLGEVANFAPVFNPYMLRVFSYAGYDYQGTLLSGASQPTVLELVGPSKSDAWRWATWTQLEVNRGDTCPTTSGNSSYCGLRSQMIIQGKPSTLDGKPSILRLVRTENNADPTLGFVYQSALSGSFRFSVAQKSGSPNSLNKVPDFNDVEGVYFKNVDAFLPLGRLHSQALTMNAPDSSGNFQLKITAIPNAANAYNDIYCGSTSCTTQVESTDFFGNSVTAIASPNTDTHGYVRWGSPGSFGTSAPSMSGTDATNGIYFRNPSGTVTNIGSARLEGVLLQSMTLTTLGAGS